LPLPEVDQWGSWIGRPPFISRSAKTRSWEKAEEFKRELEAEYEAKQSGDREVVALAPEKDERERRGNRDSYPR